MMKISVIGMDIAKRVIQLHTVCPETGEIGRFKLQRRETLDFRACWRRSNTDQVFRLNSDQGR
ncbi:hypothetical protein SAMN05216242_1431 [Thauera chlorobenzoica]|nr:hypothetical protein SAMN05216242_1431 [Thauera chlorobenzoica]